MELLIVVGIIVLLTAISIPAFGGAKARNLAAGGNLLVDLVNQARQNAAAQNSLTALVLVDGTSNKDLNNRLFTLLELKSGATAWTPVTPWQMLPAGVVVDPGESTVWASLPAGTAQFGTSGTLRYGGFSIPSGQYKYQIFAPDGHLLLGIAENPSLRLVQGSMLTATQVQYIPKGSPNYYKVLINYSTGVPKISRPH